jgi:hypothetical protein
MTAEIAQVIFVYVIVIVIGVTLTYLVIKKLK